MSLSRPPGDAVDEAARLGVSRALIDDEFERIAASGPFRSSARHLRFLRHLIECRLAGQTTRLREMALAIDVFHRNPERFDPRTDSIVRVEARRLRQKLARYQEQQGLGARLEFVLPVGSYEIEFRRRVIDPGAQQPRVSVAVFDLFDATADASDAAHAAFADGLSFDLAGALVRLNGLRVVAAGVAPADDDALRRRAEESKAAAMLVGELRLEPGTRQLQLALKLTRTADGSLLWSRRQPIGRGDSSDQLDRLARAIVAELQREAQRDRLQDIRLAGTAPLVRGRVGAEVRERLDLARIGMRLNSPAGFAKAATLAREAIELAPAHAPAHVLLAQALIGAAGLTAVPSAPALEAAGAAAQQAVALDGELADAHGELGTVRFCFEYDWPAAESSMLRALRFAPAQATSHARYGWALMMNRRFDEARTEYEEALQLDPLSLLYRAHRALIELYAREYDLARRALEQVLAVAPEHLIALALRAALLLYAGEAAAGRAAYQGLAQRFPQLSIGRCGLAQAWALLGEEAAARRELAWLLEAHAAGSVSPYQIAMVHARLGEPERAIEWLARAADCRDFNFVCVGVDPAFDALRAAPGFGQLLREHGFGALASSGAEVP